MKKKKSQTPRSHDMTRWTGGLSPCSACSLCTDDWSPWPVSQDSSGFAQLPEGQLAWGGWAIRLAGLCLRYPGVASFVFVTSFLEPNDTSAILKDLQWAPGSTRLPGPRGPHILGPKPKSQSC